MIAAGDRYCGFSMSRFKILITIFLLPFTTASIKNIQISSDSNRAILFDKFGFTNSGHLSISVKSANFTSIHDPSCLAFFILSNHVYFQCISEEKPQCFLDRNDTRILFNFTQLIPPQNTFNQSYQITHPDQYWLYFANCQPDSPITMNVTTEMYNLNGGYKVYLPTGQTQLPILYSVYAAVYFLFLLVWIGICVTNKKTHLPTHLLMGGLILMKALSLIFAAVYTHFVKVTGTSHGWDLVFRSFQWCRLIWLCIVFALLYISWSMSKPLVLQLLMALVLMNLVLLHSFAVSLESNPFKNWDQRDIEFTVDNYGVCSVTFAISVFVGWLLMGWAAANEENASKTQGNASKTYQTEGNASDVEENSLKTSDTKENAVWGAVELLFLGILLAMALVWHVTLCFVLIIKVQLSYFVYKHQWVGNAAEENETLLVYATMCYIFRRSVGKSKFFAIESYF